MTLVDVPIGARTFRNIDGSMSKDSASLLINGFLDEESNINTRPGLLQVADLGFHHPIDGLFWWDQQSKLIAVSQGKVVSMDTALAQTNLSSAGTVIESGRRPTFAHDGSTILVANGGRIVYWTPSGGGSTVAVLADGDAPVLVSHILFLDGYVIANLLNTGRFFFSEIDDLLTWNALDFASASGDPDTLVASYALRKEIYHFGKLSTEVWQNDGQTPFSPVEGGFINVGCIAPYSVVGMDNSVMWLSDKKKFVQFGGGGVEEVSSPYDREIQKFNVVSDCLADRIDDAGISFYKFQFPSEQRTLVYNATAKNWEEWSYWNGGGGFNEAWLGNCHAYSPLLNKHFVGSRKSDCLLHYMSPDYLDDNGNPIRMVQRTGHLNYGSNNEKHSNHFSIRAKRGSTTGTGTPRMTLRHLTNGNKWSNEIPLLLGKKGEYHNIIRKQNLGTYRTRQYEFVVTDNVGLAFGDAKEDIFVGAS